MAAHFATLNIDGRLPIPAEAQESLGIGPGSRLEMTVEDGRLILRPADLKVSETAGRSPSEHALLEEELRTWRDEEKEHELRTWGC